MYRSGLADHLIPLGKVGDASGGGAIGATRAARLLVAHGGVVRPRSDSRSRRALSGYA